MTLMAWIVVDAKRVVEDVAGLVALAAEAEAALALG